LSLLALALVSANPGTFASVIAAARPGDTIVLNSGNYRNLKITRSFASPITVDASGATVRGLAISGAGVTWRSGTIVAPKGTDGNGPNVYGALVTGSNVTFSGTTFGLARKALVLDRARNITIADSFFRGVGEDGIIVSRTVGLTVVRNSFDKVVGKPTSCATPRGLLRGLAKRDCTAKGGKWTDGFHADAVQMRNGVTDAVIADNVINADTQGLTQMDTTGDAPLARIRIERNSVAATIHHITLGKNCNDCLIRGNTVRRYKPTSYKAIIRPGKARRCENDTVDEPRDGSCGGYTSTPSTPKRSG
jgi:hypothetical protein